MAKKTFKNDIDPAMNFISKESIEKAEAETPTAIKRPAKPPEGFKFNPLYIETRSRRLQLLVQPSLYETLKKKAQAERTSVNELVNIILQDALEKE